MLETVTASASATAFPAAASAALSRKDSGATSGSAGALPLPHGWSGQLLPPAQPPSSEWGPFSHAPAAGACSERTPTGSASGGAGGTFGGGGSETDAGNGVGGDLDADDDAYESRERLGDDFQVYYSGFVVPEERTQ